jgi:DNA primase
MSASLKVPPEVIAEVKQRDLATIVGQTVQLHREGRLFAGCCPFHQERTGSFFVFPKDHCFGCGAHGDAVDFVMNANRLSFREAVTWLSGAEIGTFTPAERPPQHSDSNRNAELAQKIWTEACLPEGTIVEDYLHRRRLNFRTSLSSGSIRNVQTARTALSRDTAAALRLALLASELRRQMTAEVVV